MSGDYELGEMQRQLSNLIRAGKIVELDEANARVKVSTAGLTTDWLPWGASRAGNTLTWSPPRVGEQVIIASPYGDMGQAVVIGSLFSDERPAPADSKDKETVLYPDGAKTEHNSDTKARTDTLNPAGSSTVTVGASSVFMDTSKILMTIGASSILMEAGKILLSSNGTTVELNAAGFTVLGARVDLN